MKKSLFYSFLITVLFGIMAFKMQQGVPKERTIEPAELAKILNDPHARQPAIINMGSTPMIKNAVSGGMGYSEEAMEPLKKLVSSLDKNNLVVLYCGCCKLEHCPNVNLPYEYMKSQGFKNVKILNMETDIYADWMKKEYPMKGVK